MKRLSFTIIIVVMSFICNAQQFQIQNDLMSRTINYSGGHISCDTYKLKSSGLNFVRKNSVEFSFCINDSLYTGSSLWTDFVSCDTVYSDGTKALILSFKDREKRMAVKLTYLAYPEVASVRKFITIENCGTSDFKIENVDVENFQTIIDPTNAWTYHNFARDMIFGPYSGSNWNDALVILHNFPNFSGIAIGNEAVAVLKRTETFVGGFSLKAGLTYRDDAYPFRKWLAPGETWTSPAVFTVIYENKRNVQDVVSQDVQTIVRKYMGTQIEKRSAKPILVYNTWVPFYRNIDEKLIFELATAASQCGAGEFVIDDGWQINVRTDLEKGKIYADWGIDTVKFPRGFKPVFDSIKALGMKPGLWISIANCYKNGIAYNQHPEWVTKDINGKKTSLHSASSTSPATACMGTDWCDYIRDIILSYVRDYGLAYVKLDLGIVTSAYIYDDARTGCYATDHKYHRDRAESYWTIYDRCMKMFDELHSAAPELFIDCTFETAGKLQLMDYGISLHADGNWLSNIGQSVPDGSLRVRNLAWRRTPALHPVSLVIGNLKMHDPNHILALKSLAGTLPIMLGDPRKLSKEERDEFKQWTTWLTQLEKRHGFMSFRQDLRGFGEPMDGMWDGFSRINTETKSGGLVGIFRENSAESTRRVVINGLDDKCNYQIKKGFSGEKIAEMSGLDLSRKGFMVEISDSVGGELFEVIKN